VAAAALFVLGLVALGCSVATAVSGSIGLARLLLLPAIGCLLAQRWIRTGSIKPSNVD
jgi:hypothetical protein